MVSLGFGRFREANWLATETSRSRNYFRAMKVPPLKINRRPRAAKCPPKRDSATLLTGKIREIRRLANSSRSICIRSLLIVENYPPRHAPPAEIADFCEVGLGRGFPSLSLPPATITRLTLAELTVTFIQEYVLGDGLKREQLSRMSARIFKRQVCSLYERIVPSSWSR